MGQAIADVLANDAEFRLASVWARVPDIVQRRPSFAGALVSDDLARVVDACSVLIDFSLPAASGEILARAAESGRPLVCGVSGLDAAQTALFSKTAEQIPIVYDRNMSQGIAVLDSLIQQAASALGREFEVRVGETHHAHKVDAPSGTALKIGATIAAARGVPASSINYEVERRGEVPGIHTVEFRSPAETLTFSHTVTTRAVFAEGALRAARWLMGRPPGLYTMRDVLF